jgi:hypothetical protein
VEVHHGTLPPRPCENESVLMSVVGPRTTCLVPPARGRVPRNSSLCPFQCLVGLLPPLVVDSPLPSVPPLSFWSGDLIFVDSFHTH